MKLWARLARELGEWRSLAHRRKRGTLRVRLVQDQHPPLLTPIFDF